MKSIVYALVAAALLLGLVLAPVKPVSASASAQTTTCGDTYTVQRGDYLVKIAKICGISYETLLKNNPEIKTPSLIYPGDVIRIKGGAVVTPTPTTPAYSGEYTVVRGDTLYLIANRFGTTVTELLKVNPEIKNSSVIYVGQKIRLPVTATSPTGARVSLSTTSAKVGAVVEVKVTGFPKNANLDLRLGKQGAAYSVVVDGTTDATGAATAKVTIPAAAKSGEKWVVVVMTTELVKTVSLTSPVITIAP